MIIIVHHGKRQDGPNPSLEEEGLRHMHTIKNWLAASIARRVVQTIDAGTPLPDEEQGVSFIISGTGKRFMETAKKMELAFPKARLLYSPWLGGAESISDSPNRQSQVVTAHGKKFPRSNYMAPSDSATDRAAAWPKMMEIENMAPGYKILCSGRSLLNLLDSAIPTSSGSVYELDLQAKQVKRIYDGYKEENIPTIL